MTPSSGLRIIAGNLRGRRLRVAAAAAVRPTPERVREALFSILVDRIGGAVVLDAFAGSGALGFEALSRGAARVVFVESDRRVAAMLRSNASVLGVEDACHVVEGIIPGVLTREEVVGPYDVVLADPPYDTTITDCERTLESLAEVLGSGGVLVWERATGGQPTLVPRLAAPRTRRYGNTSVDLYRPADLGPGGG